MNKSMMHNIYEGNTISHWPGKTITESDNNIFCLLTMNHHPVHIDKEYARNCKHQKILVVGTYVLSLVVGLSVRDISMEAVANLEYNDVVHVAPTFIGDTLYARSKILKVEKTKNANHLVANIETEGFNQNSTVVIRFRRLVLLNNHE